VLKNVFGQARAAFLSVLDDQTIADLVIPAQRLRKRLKITGPAPVSS
jgi:hypothetical protein